MGAGNGPRSFENKDFAPGSSLIDTNHEFEVSASFYEKGGKLDRFVVELRQGHGTNLTVMDSSWDKRKLSKHGAFNLNDHTIPTRLHANPEKYGYEGPEMDDLTKTLEAGVTPIFSFWSAKNMDWMDGPGDDGLGPCKEETMGCNDMNVEFGNIMIEHIPTDDNDPRLSSQRPARAEDGDVPHKPQSDVSQEVSIGKPSETTIDTTASPATDTSVSAQCAKPAPAYVQCGGPPGWNGPACCESGCDCRSTGDKFYKQCFPLGGGGSCGTGAVRLDESAAFAGSFSFKGSDTLVAPRVFVSSALVLMLGAGIVLIGRRGTGGLVAAYSSLVGAALLAHSTERPHD